MPSTTITISREQRQPLHRLVTQHISGIGDVYLMIEQRDFATTERLGLEFGEDLRVGPVQVAVLSSPPESFGSRLRQRFE